jgi:hypothetical protein
VGTQTSALTIEVSSTVNNPNSLSGTIKEAAMNRNFNSAIMALALVPAALAQSNPNSATPQQQGAVVQAAPSSDAPRDLVLHDGTPVRMRLSRTLSSEEAKTGDEIDFSVLDEVTVGGRVVIAQGTKAIGSITEAEHKRRMGRGGKLTLVLDYVRLEDGTKVALRAQRDTKGGGHVGAMTAGMTAAVILGFGLPAPLFLLMHGKEAVIPQGTELTAYVEGDTRINPSTTISALR